MVEVSVRRMEGDDARAFLEMHRSSVHGVACVDYPPEVIEAWSPPVTDERISAFLENPDKEVRFVADLDGEIVGIGAVVLESNELRACYVAPGGVRKGVGTQIVQELERVARANGVRSFNLVSSVTAEPFYNARP
jgi:putative acetyltransferase